MAYYRNSLEKNYQENKWKMIYNRNLPGLMSINFYRNFQEKITRNYSLQ